MYKAVGCTDEEGIFHFHEKPNTDCPVGRNIHAAMDERLKGIQNAMEEQMKEISLSDVAVDVKKKIRLE